MDLRKFALQFAACALAMGVFWTGPATADEGRNLALNGAVRPDASPTDENAPLLFQMAKSYWYGEDGYPQDRARAIELMKKSARADYPPALYYLSRIYITGESTPVDEKAGIALLKRAAQLGLSDAQRQLLEFEQEKQRRSH